MKSVAAVILLFFSLTSQSLADPLSFSPSEKQIHNRYIKQITAEAALCLKNLWTQHIDFYNRYGVSKFYGDRNVALNTREKRIAALKYYGAEAWLIDELEPTSCIGMTLDCLGRAFHNTMSFETSQLWNKIDSHVRANRLSGTHLINALQGLGWKIIYWNPAPDQNGIWDAEDPTLIPGKPVDWESPVKDGDGNSIFHPAWGLHAAHYKTVMEKDTYYISRVDDKSFLVDFGIGIPREFQKIPFFIGVAHAGYHVFPGVSGEVIEAHSTRRLNVIDNIEKSEFNPIAPQGGPRSTPIEKYRSGVIAVPPNFEH